MFKELAPHPEKILLICTSCNDCGLISREALAKLLRENGRAETICHCGGTMILPKEKTQDLDLGRGLISQN